jgi:hypothetical protein
MESASPGPYHGGLWQSFFAAPRFGPARATSWLKNMTFVNNEFREQ